MILTNASLFNLGSFYGKSTANQNMIEIFNVELESSDSPTITAIRQIAIEAPSGTKLKINDVEIVMPSTGILEIPRDYTQIYSLIFDSEVDVNIVYFY